MAIDTLRVRKPGGPVRLLGVVLFLLGLVLLANSLIAILGGGWLSLIYGSFELIGWLGLLNLEFFLILLRWEVVVDRPSRSISRRSSLLWTIQHDRYTFDDFDAVEIVGLAAADTSAHAFAVRFSGPDVSLDIDDPGKVPSAALFQLIARLEASLDRTGRLALAISLANLAGLELRDTLGLARPSPEPPRRPLPRATSPDPVGPVLKISRMPAAARLALLVLFIASSLMTAMIVSSERPGGGMAAARAVADALAVAILPLGALVALTYRGRVAIDFPSRLVQRRGSFLGVRWDESYPLEQFDEVIVREIRVPLLKSVARAVLLSGALHEVPLYGDKNVPRALRPEQPGLDRGGRCLASAVRLAGALGLPLRVVQQDLSEASADNPHPEDDPDGEDQSP